MNGRNAPLITAIRGPLMVITLGALFAAGSFGGYGFGQTWPVLIIVFGILKLLERTLGPRLAGPPAPGGNVS
jgi:fatty acid desaturase